MSCLKKTVISKGQLSGGVGYAGDVRSHIHEWQLLRRSTCKLEHHSDEIKHIIEVFPDISDLFALIHMINLSSDMMAV